MVGTSYIKLYSVLFYFLKLFNKLDYSSNFKIKHNNFIKQNYRW